MDSLLEIQCGHGRCIAHFFEQRGNHHRTEAHRVGGDHNEDELKCQANGREAIVKAGMGDRRRIVTADGIENEE